jgi:hypothetical protein
MTQKYPPLPFGLDEPLIEETGMRDKQASIPLWLAITRWAEATPGEFAANAAADFEDFLANAFHAYADAVVEGRHPLTDEQLNEGVDAGGWSDWETFSAGARWAESMHGIGAPDQKDRS